MQLLSLGFLLAVIVLPLWLSRDASPARGLRRTLTGFVVASIAYAVLMALLLPGTV